MRVLTHLTVGSYVCLKTVASIGRVSQYFANA